MSRSYLYLAFPLSDPGLGALQVECTIIPSRIPECFVASREGLVVHLRR